MRRLMFRTVMVCALTLAMGSAVAVPAFTASRAHRATFTTYFGPMYVSPGTQNDYPKMGAVNTDSGPQTVGLAIFDGAGSIVSSQTVTISPSGSAVVVWDPNCPSGCDLYGRIRSQSPRVRGTLELIDSTTGVPTVSTASASLFGGSQAVGVAGPVTMSDELTEELLIANVGATDRTVTTTFYDSSGTVIGTLVASVGARQTITQSFPTAAEGQAVHAVITDSGTGRLVIGSVAGLDVTGGEIYLSPTGTACPPGVQCGP